MDIVLVKCVIYGNNNCINFRVLKFEKLSFLPDVKIHRDWIVNWFKLKFLYKNWDKYFILKRLYCIKILTHGFTDTYFKPRCFEETWMIHMMKETQNEENKNVWTLCRIFFATLRKFSSIALESVKFESLTSRFMTFTSNILYCIHTANCSRKKW